MIRPYRESDLHAVARLFTESVHGLGSAHYDETQLAAWAPTEPDISGWRARLAQSTTLVAEVDNELAGFISYEQNGHIDLLYVSPKHARRGIASELYNQAEADLKVGGVVEMFTEASMVARPFFERCGFHVIEEQCIERRGVTFRRYGMRKLLASDR
jgi:Acetyltransferases|nr:GNAT family N-acetyltransferase [uncultured Steroidobacter sp.]